MPSERYYLAEDLEPHDKKILKDSEFHHLAHVMRTRKGENIELINGKGALAKATVVDILKDQAVLILDDVQNSEKKNVKIILAQALPRQNRLEFVLEKGTELGVDEFWLFPGATSIKKEFYPSQIERAQTLTISAMKQCGRLTLPSIQIKPEIKMWDKLTTSAFFGDVDASSDLFSEVWNKTPLTLPIVFITGPESGFTDSEVSQLRSKGALGVKLHDHILRTDTASMTAVSLISHWMMSKDFLPNLE
jgi:16S rRNA (uracil1498-N3)-methyltransferase